MAEPFAAADKPRPVPPARIFGFWDVTALIVGIVVGTAIFKTPAFIFQNVHTLWQGLAVWGIGGLLSLCGALCYAELATSLPRNGGDYEYLGRAYWPGFGFLFVGDPELEGAAVGVIVDDVAGVISLGVSVEDFTRHICLEDESLGGV